MPIQIKQKTNIGITFNEKVFNELNQVKTKEIKDILNKSFLKTQNILVFRDHEINFESIENMVMYFKKCEENILVIHRKEISYYTY